MGSRRNSPTPARMEVRSGISVNKVCDRTFRFFLSIRRQLVHRQRYLFGLTKDHLYRSRFRNSLDCLNISRITGFAIRLDFKFIFPKLFTCIRNQHTIRINTGQSYHILFQQIIIIRYFYVSDRIIIRCCPTKHNVTGLVLSVSTQVDHIRRDNRLCIFVTTTSESYQK